MANLGTRCPWDFTIMSAAPLPLLTSLPNESLSRVGGDDFVHGCLNGGSIPFGSAHASLPKTAENNLVSFAIDKVDHKRALGILSHFRSHCRPSHVAPVH